MNDRILEAAGAAPEPGAPAGVAGQPAGAHPPSPPPAGDGTFDPAEDLEVLFPDRDVTVRDPDSGEPVTLTVREFRYLEGLRVQVSARDFIAALADARGDRDAVHDALAVHADVWADLIARAADRDPAWIARLSDRDGDAVAVAAWGANRDFFLRRILARLRPAAGSPRRGLRRPRPGRPWPRTPRRRPPPDLASDPAILGGRRAAPGDGAHGGVGAQ